jgi:uncharacterized protein YdcH (DUF465 family)
MIQWLLNQGSGLAQIAAAVVLSILVGRLLFATLAKVAVLAEQIKDLRAADSHHMNSIKSVHERTDHLITEVHRDFVHVHELYSAELSRIIHEQMALRHGVKRYERVRTRIRELERSDLEPKGDRSSNRKTGGNVVKPSGGLDQTTGNRESDAELGRGDRERASST